MSAVSREGGGGGGGGGRYLSSFHFLAADYHSGIGGQNVVTNQSVTRVVMS